ncbi:TasA family protein [Agathobacter sp.]
MKNKRMGLSIAAASLVGVLAMGATLAYFTDKDSASNVFTMGKVGIDLVEDTKEGESVEITDSGIHYDGIVPGDEVSKIANVVVDSDSEDAYIRVMVTADSSSKELLDHMAELTDQIRNIVAEDEKWTLKADGYLYYSDIVSADEVINIFDTVSIPASWGNEIAGETFNVNITAYAVQADNFTGEWPEF